MRQSDATPQDNPEANPSAPLAPGAIVGTGNGIPEQTPDQQSNAPPLDSGTAPLQTLPAQTTVATEGKTAEQTAERSQTLSAPLANPAETCGGKAGAATRVAGEAHHEHVSDSLNLHRSELRTLRAAVRTERAVITDDERRAVPSMVAKLATSAKSARLRLAACKTWVQLDSLNLRAEIAASEAERVKAQSGSPSVTVNVNVGADSGPLARIRRLQGESGESGESDGAGG